MTPVGTIEDWFRAVFGAVFWGTMMFILRGVGNSSREDSSPPPLYVARLVAGSILFGLFLGFEFQAFRWPLILLTSPFFLALLIMAFLARRKRRSVT